MGEGTMSTQILNREAILQVIRQFTGQQNILTIPRVIIEFTGDILTALFLNQLIYWHDRKEPGEWIYKTDAEWKNELAISRDQLVRVRDKLINIGILQITQRRVNGLKKTHYRLLWNNFVDQFMKFLEGWAEKKPHSVRSEENPHSRSMENPQTDLWETRISTIAETTCKDYSKDYLSLSRSPVAIFLHSLTEKEKNALKKAERHSQNTVEAVYDYMQEFREKGKDIQDPFAFIFRGLADSWDLSGEPEAWKEYMKMAGDL
jgi:hypothetical protein